MEFCTDDRLKLCIEPSITPDKTGSGDFYDFPDINFSIIGCYSSSSPITPDFSVVNLKVGFIFTICTVYGRINGEFGVQMEVLQKPEVALR